MERIDVSSEGLAHFFRTLVHEAFDVTGLREDRDVETYLVALLQRFMHTDRVFGIRDAFGRRLSTVTEMLAEGDLRMNADSFERERQVHRHIGDFLLFWSGLYPSFLRQIRQTGLDVLCDYVRQGKESYSIAASFDYPPYQEESRTLRKLSEGFEDYSDALHHVGRRLPLPPGGSGQA